MSDRYVPAAGRAAFTGLYDPVMSLTMRESRWRPLLIEEVSRRLHAGGAIIDVGAGTGSLATEIAKRRPDAHVIGVDGDPEAIAIARRKRGAELVDWRAGLAAELPVADGTASAVVLSLLLHHLTSKGKTLALAEAGRVLRPGGALWIADWGRPRDLSVAAGFLALRALDGFENTRDHARGRLPHLIDDIGFVSISVERRVRTMWGSLEVLTASRP